MNKPGTVALQNAVIKRFNVGTYGIYIDRNIRGGTTKSVHAEGRAWDCKTTDYEEGTKVYNTLREHHEALGIEKIIWWRKVWTPSMGEQDYTGVSPHTNHLHIEQSVEKSESLTEQDILELL